MIKRKQKLGSSSSSICKHKSLNRCGSHIQYRVYYKDAHIRLLGLFSVFFDSLQRKKQKKVEYWSNICLFQREERETGDCSEKSYFIFEFVSPVCLRDWAPPKRFSFKKEKKNPLPRFFSSYILSTSLISFPQIQAVWFTFLFMLFMIFLCLIYPFCLHSLHQLICQTVFVYYFENNETLSVIESLYKSLSGIVDKSVSPYKNKSEHISNWIELLHFVVSYLLSLYNYS